MSRSSSPARVVVAEAHRRPGAGAASSAAGDGVEPAHLRSMTRLAPIRHVRALRVSQPGDARSGTDRRARGARTACSCGAYGLFPSWPRLPSRSCAVQSDQRLAALATRPATSARSRRSSSATGGRCYATRGGSSATARAEDAVQQALLSAWAALERGDDVRELARLAASGSSTTRGSTRCAGSATSVGAARARSRPARTPHDVLERRLTVRETLEALAAAARAPARGPPAHRRRGPVAGGGRRVARADATAPCWAAGSTARGRRSGPPRPPVDAAACRLRWRRSVRAASRSPAASPSWSRAPGQARRSRRRERSR